MKVTILSPEQTLYEGEATMLRLPGRKGRFEVLDRHAPIITTLDAGEVSIEGETPYTIDVTGGFAEIADDVAVVCVEQTVQQSAGKEAVK